MARAGKCEDSSNSKKRVRSIISCKRLAISIPWVVSLASIHISWLTCASLGVASHAGAAILALWGLGFRAVSFELLIRAATATPAITAEGCVVTWCVGGGNLLMAPPSVSPQVWRKSTQTVVGTVADCQLTACIPTNYRKNSLLWKKFSNSILSGITVSNVCLLYIWADIIYDQHCSTCQEFSSLSNIFWAFMPWR